MRVIIVGIGDVGTQLAENLNVKKGTELVLIDRDEDKCRSLSREYDALVLHGDGTEPDLLEEAGINFADALIASTESDALNMVISTLGKRFSVSKVVVKLNNIKLRTTARELGADYVVSPKISAATEISSMLCGYDVLDFSLLIQGGMRLIEISPGKQDGKRISEIELPAGILITSILREELAIIPRGDTVLDEDDILVVLAENEEKETKVKNVFGENQMGPRPPKIEPNRS